MINAIEWFEQHGFTFDDKITVHDVIKLQNDSWEAGAGHRFPPLPEIMGRRITRADVIEALFSLRDDSYRLERMKDSTFRSFPDLETILEYIAVNGLEPKAAAETAALPGSAPSAVKKSEP